MNTKTLQILFAEDSENDVQLAVNELKRYGYEPTCTRVQTAAELSAALLQQPWDVILSDYSMPGFTGSDALKICQESGRDIPFISVSGTLGEESAVAMMRAGAHDYFTKDNLIRLGPAIEREMNAAGSRREQKRMQDAAAHLAAVVESSDDAIISKSLDGIVVSWNKGAEQIYGYTEEEMIGRPISDLVPPARAGELTEILVRIRAGESVSRFDTLRVRKDGTIVEVSVTISPIKNAAGQIIGASAIARDITERRREEEERLRLIDELTQALKQAKTLRGLLPICASCKKIRDDQGYWQQVEVYIEEHTEAGFTHGLCPGCVGKYFPEITDEPAP
jgi:two-component system, cell cycle sensor histidine kinase and response regulator CckA